TNRTLMRGTPKWCRAIRTRASPSTEASNDGPTGESTRLAAARPPSRRLEHRSVRQALAIYPQSVMAWESEWAVTRGGKGRVVPPAPEETKLSRGGSARVALPTAEARRGVQHHQRRPAGSLGGGWRPGAGRYARPKRPAAAYPSRTHGSSRTTRSPCRFRRPWRGLLGVRV